MLDKVKEALEYYEQEGNYREGDLATEALTELNTFIESNGWQDISDINAKEGKIIATDYHFTACYVFWGKPYYGKNNTETWCKEVYDANTDSSVNEGLFFTPTHWQPLPAIKSIKE